MTHYETYIREFADPRQTSYEIAQAIFDTAADGDEGRMWEAPTEEEMAAVMALAWQYADPDEDTLHWGVETMRRSTEARALAYAKNALAEVTIDPEGYGIDSPWDSVDQWIDFELEGDASRVFDSKEERAAIIAAMKQVADLETLNSPFEDQIKSECTCQPGRRDKWCPEHGLDPDAEYDRRRDDAMWDKEQGP